MRLALWTGGARTSFDTWKRRGGGGRVDREYFHFSHETRSLINPRFFELSIAPITRKWKLPPVVDPRRWEETMPPTLSLVEDIAELRGKAEASNRITGEIYQRIVT